MNRKEIIKQLESLIENAKSFMVPGDSNVIWKRDIKALNYAIDAIEQNEKFITGLKEIRNNLRCIDGPTEHDEYIDDSLTIIKSLIKSETRDIDE